MSKNVLCCIGNEFLHYGEATISDIELTKAETSVRAYPGGQQIVCYNEAQTQSPKSCSVSGDIYNVEETTSTYVTLSDTFHATEPISLQVCGCQAAEL